jgi:hypothetical protein
VWSVGAGDVNSHVFLLRLCGVCVCEGGGGMCVCVCVYVCVWCICIIMVQFSDYRSFVERG